MARPSMYDLVSREVGPLNDAMRALVELNWHAEKAREAGWQISFGVNPDTRDVDVTVDRVGAWPSEESEAAKAEPQS